MSKCFGIIFDNVAYDVALIDNKELGTLMHTQLLFSGSNTFTRQYGNLRRPANTWLKKIKEAYEKHDAA